MKKRQPRPDLAERNRKKWRDDPAYREKMRAICIGNRWGALRTLEGKARSIEAMSGPESNRKKSIALIGNTHVASYYAGGGQHPMKGKTQSAAACEAMCKAWTPERRAKQAEKMHGNNFGARNVVHAKTA